MRRTSKDDREQGSAPRASKRPYVAPRLVRYGDVALGELYRGASRPLSPAETKALYGAAGMEQRQPVRSRLKARRP